jgi:hypothetical protein
VLAGSISCPGWWLSFIGWSGIRVGACAPHARTLESTYDQAVRLCEQVCAYHGSVRWSVVRREALFVRMEVKDRP